MSISRETELKHDGNNRSLAYQRGVLLQLESQVRRVDGLGRPGLRELEAENTKLKKLLAEAELDNSALKHLLNRTL